MKPGYVALFLFFLAALQGHAQSATFVSRLDSLIRAANGIGVFNGVVLVAEDRRIIYQQAYGYADAQRKQPLSTGMRFYIGSVSKEFNSTGILRLKEEGKLSLDDSVSRYLEGLPAWAGKIRISHLLDYTSGLPQMDANSGEQWRRALAELPALSFQPGTAYIYSNANIFLQQQIIERVGGMGYESFIRQRLFLPLQLPDILIDSFKNINNLARPFDNEFRETPGLDSATGMMVTAEGLYRWTQALADRKLVNSASLAVLAKSFGNNEGSLGAAKVTDGRLVMHVHQGSGYNYECLLYQQDQPDIVVILLTNNQNFKVNELKDAIVNLLQDQPYQVPKRSIYLDIRAKLLNSFEQGIAYYEWIKTAGRDRYDLSHPEIDLYNTAKYLMRRARYDDAIRILHLSTLEDLHNTGGMSYAFTLIGDCYRKLNQPLMALVYYKKAVELDSGNLNAKGMVQEMSQGAEKR
jgi:CubicO group peptidase (beta-lactamase class C family)